MDPAADRTRLDQAYRLLALCARAQGHPAFYEQLGAQVNAFTAWDLLPAQAELHGMSALLWHHLRQSGLAIPADTEHTLAVLYLRQQALNRLHTQVLIQTCTLLEGRGIQPLLLKGLALAHQYYAEPALRSVSDIDLLLQRSEIAPAVDALLAGGFTALELDGDLSSSPPAEVRLLAPAASGTRTPLELHHGQVGRLPLHGPMRDAELAGLDAAPQSVEISGRPVLVPGPAPLLDYLLRHFQRHLFEASASRPLPLKWVADILSVLERHAPEPGWSDRLRHDRPLMERLQIFYSLTPLPEHLVDILPVRAAAPPAGVNRYPGGWPRENYRSHAAEGPLRFILQTFAAPSTWWLRLHYGISQRSCWWYGVVVHPLYVLGLIARGAMRRLLRGAWLLLRRSSGRVTERGGNA